MKDLKLTYEQKLELAVWLAEVNNGYITGSLMLREMGIDLGRESGDVDIVVSDSQEILLPPLCTLNYNDDKPYTSISAFFLNEDTKIDFIIDTDLVDTLDNYWSSRPGDDLFGFFRNETSKTKVRRRLAPVTSALEAKEGYLKLDSYPPYLEKTRKDIEIINRWIAERGGDKYQELVDSMTRTNK